MDTADDGSLGHSAPSGRPPFRGLSLADYVERQFDEMASGPTMADILRAIDERGRPTGLTTDMIVATLHEGRRERDEQLEEI